MTVAESWDDGNVLSRSFLAVLAATATGVLAPMSAAVAAPAAVTPPAALDLGSLGDPGYSIAQAISGNIVVGTSFAPGGFERAFAENLGAAHPVMLDLGTLGGSSSQATSVSDDIVVGASDTTANNSIQEHAFAENLRSRSPVMRDLGTLGGDISAANAVSGDIVVGSSETASGTGHAFAYDLRAAHPGIVELGSLGGITSVQGMSGNIAAGYSVTASGATDAVVWYLHRHDF